MLFCDSVFQHCDRDFQFFCDYVSIDKFVFEFRDDKSIIDDNKFDFTNIKNSTFLNVFDVESKLEMSCKRILLFEK